MSELAHLEFLFTVAEVAAAFVGFSLISSILRNDERDPRFLMMRDVAQVGLTAIAGSLLPYLLFAFGMRADSLWRASGGGLLLAWLVGGAFAYRRASKSRSPMDWAPSLYVSASLSNASGSGLLLWTIFVGGSLLGPFYLLALSILLGLAGLMFIWATFEGPSDRHAV